MNVPPLIPRRGGAPAPAAEPVPDAGAALKELLSDPGIEGKLALSDSDPELVAAARSYLDGEPAPLGAGVAGAIALSRHENAAPALVDGWIAAHDLAFTACAATEMNAVIAGARLGRARGLENPGAPKQIALIRVRMILAGADETEYREAVEQLAGLRGAPMNDVTSAFLVPGERAWVDACCSLPVSGWSRWALLCSLGAAGQLEQLGDRARPARRTWHDPVWSLVPTMIDGLGAAAVPWLAEALAIEDRRAEAAEGLASLPDDEALRLLVRHSGHKHVQAALLEAMERFPVHAARALARGTDHVLLATHLRRHPEITAETLPEEVRPVVERIRAAEPHVPEAAPDELPPLLAAPPWLGERPEPVVLKVKAPAEPVVAWEPGERRAWLETPCPYSEAMARGEELPPARDTVTGSTEGLRATEPTAYWHGLLAARQDNKLTYEKLQSLLVLGPDELLRPLLAKWKLEYNCSPAVLKVLLGRFETDLLPNVLPLATDRPYRYADLLVPFRSPKIAAFMAKNLPRNGAERHAAIAWLRRHGADAVPPLLPNAFASPSPRRTLAEKALLFLAGEIGADTVIAAVRPYGDQAADGIAAMLAENTAEFVPDEIPEVGAWADPAALPPVLLRGRERALPDTAVRNLLTLLAMEGEVFERVRPALDPASLARFGWALFRLWQANGEPSGDAWALTSLGLTGDDDVARRLSPIIRAWPGENGHHKAVKGVGALSAIGTDAALMELHAIAEKVKFRGLREHAQAQMGSIAEKLGLSGEELADRLVPDFGLDGLVLDYGPRRFTVGFDEQLRPFVRDESGKLRKALPKPGAKDDPDLAPAAYQRFTQLKKDVRAIASIQMRRLEQAMVDGRRWAVPDFRRFFAGHPLMRHIAHRLVWLADDGTAFRIAEDGSFADVADDAYTPPDGARVRVAHPVHLDGAIARWAELFEDYEISQPFPQLARPVLAFTTEERAAWRLTRFEGVSAPAGKVLGLVKRGWERGPALDNGYEYGISRPLPGGLHLMVRLYPGIQVGSPYEFDEQRLDDVWITARYGGYFRPEEGPHRFGELDALTACELLIDLEGLLSE
ncbi:DUF4132 domain-containing protein [Actinomadura macrotermitis]|uniref:DUF4132 domain-containing protein n=1 Tax=Actinomadura macrotermitis TaxID=2585200 RepID=A0A7K0C794_9ACTN|nr:DUF4132 domain-containing protein [Actinomadura macrotermitis]MQY09341.1 hypothetical protein [Actinomadura macrotermitis]